MTIITYMDRIITITLLLTTVGVWCASLVSSMGVMNVEQWQSGSGIRQEVRDGRSLRGYFSDGRQRLKRNSDNSYTHVYKDALFTSPNTAYFQKNQTHHLRCPSWRLGERLSSVFWYRGTTLVVLISAPNEPGKNFTAGKRYRLVDDHSGLIIYNVTGDDSGLYDCRVVPTNTKRERRGLVAVEILDSTFPADVVSMDSINIPLLSQNVNRQDGGRIKCPHSTTDAAATYWSLDKGEGVDTEIIGAEYSNKDTLVLDKYKEDYQITNGGDLQILSLQRPQSRYWCHRFLNGLAVGFVNVTGVVVANQDRPTITGCELLPEDKCQVNFEPDKDLQLVCSVLKVYPKVTLYWEDVSKCDINFHGVPFESFDDVTKTYDQEQRLIVKAGSLSTDCQPKFVCKATGVATPVQPFGAEVLLVKSGATWIIVITFILVAISTVLISLLIIFKGRCNHLIKNSRFKDIEANENKSDDPGCQVPVVCHPKYPENHCEMDWKHTALTTREQETTQQSLDCEENVAPTIKEQETTQQSRETENDVKTTAKQQPSDESKALLSQTSQFEELKPDKSEHVEIHPTSSNSFSPRKWLMQAQNIVVHIHQYVGEKTPTKRNRTKSKQNKHRKGASHQQILMETVSDSDQHNLEVHIPVNSSSPLLSNTADSTLEGEQGDDKDESDLHEVSVTQEIVETHEEPHENEDQQLSSSEVACEPRQKVEPHHDTKTQPEQHILDEANSDFHLTEDEVNLQLEDDPEISISEDEACPSDESKALLSQTSQFEELKPDKSEHVEIDPSSSNSFSPRRNWLMQNNAVHEQQQYGGEKTPTKGNHTISKQKKYGKRTTPYQQVSKKTDESKSLLSQTSKKTGTKISLSDHQNCEVNIPVNSSSLPLSNMADSTLEGEQRDDKDESDLHEVSFTQETVETHEEPHENEYQQMSSSEVGCEPRQKVEPHHDTESEKQIFANSDFHLTQEEVNIQREDLPEISMSEEESDSKDSGYLSPPSPNELGDSDQQDDVNDEPATQENQGTRKSSQPLGSCIDNETATEETSTDQPADKQLTQHTSPPAPLANQDDQHYQLPSQSDYCEQTPRVYLDSSGSRRPNPLQSDDEEMGSDKSDSGNEMEDGVNRDVSDAVGYDQQHEATPVEMDVAVAVDNPQEMVDSEEEVVERPKRDPKKRQSNTTNRLQKQNPLITNNLIYDRRQKVPPVH